VRLAGPIRILSALTPIVAAVLLVPVVLVEDLSPKTL